MSRKWIAVIVVASVIAGTTAFAAVRHGRAPVAGAFPFLRGVGFLKLQARLNLSADQTQQIKQIVKSERMKRIGQGRDGAQDQQALIKSIFADNPNQTEIQQRVQAIQEQQAKMLQELVATGLQVNKVFTPEQRAELQRMMDENAQVRAKMRQKMAQRMKQQQQAPKQ